MTKRVFNTCGGGGTMAVDFLHLKLLLGLLVLAQAACAGAAGTAAELPSAATESAPAVQAQTLRLELPQLHSRETSPEKKKLLRRRRPAPPHAHGAAESTRARRQTATRKGGGRCDTHATTYGETGAASIGCDAACEAGCDDAQSCDASCDKGCDDDEEPCNGGCDFDTYCDEGCDYLGACDHSCASGCDASCQPSCDDECDTSCNEATGCDAGTLLCPCLGRECYF